MTSGAVRRRAGDRPPVAGDGSAPDPVVRTGRPSWWAVLVAVLVATGLTVDLLRGGPAERLDLRVSQVATGWALEESAAYPALWALTQVGGRATILVVLLALVGYLAWRRRTWRPAARVLLALVLLTGTVYAVKLGAGRTAPNFPGSFFFTDDGRSFPSGHVANAVLMWGVARWQAVEYRLPARVQRAFWWLSVIGPLVTAAAMVSLDFHWVSDAVVGAAVGLALLGVVHALDGVLLSRWVHARSDRPSA